VHHAPFRLKYWGQTAPLRHVNGPTVSDYYGGCVTVADIQNRFSHSVHSRAPVRAWRSAVGNLRLAKLKHKHIMLSDATFAIFHFPVAGFAPSIL